MDKVGIRTLVFVGSIVLLATGCVSNKRHNREIGVLQSQVNALSTEVSRLDAESQARKESGLAGMVKQLTSPAPAPKPVVADFTSSAMYRTPSGF